MLRVVRRAALPIGLTPSLRVLYTQRNALHSCTPHPKAGASFVQLDPLLSFEHHAPHPTKAGKARRTCKGVNYGSIFKRDPAHRKRENESGSDDLLHPVWSNLPPANDEQLAAIKLALDGGSIFITGGAGTGKSVTLHHIASQLPRTSTAITASTGVAAFNIRGTTVHSFFGYHGDSLVHDIPPTQNDDQGIDIADDEGELALLTHTERPFRDVFGQDQAHEQSAEVFSQYLRTTQLMAKYINSNYRLRMKWRALRTLIIDEISMLPGPLFDLMDGVAQVLKGECNKPFGGVQLILCGDFLQLPPIVGGTNSEQKNSCEMMAFASNAWRQLNPTVANFKGVERQHDPRFVKFLNRVRVGDFPYDDGSPEAELGMKLMARSSENAGRESTTTRYDEGRTDDRGEHASVDDAEQLAALGFTPPPEFEEAFGLPPSGLDLQHVSNTDAETDHPLHASLPTQKATRPAPEATETTDDTEDARRKEEEQRQRADNCVMLRTHNYMVDALNAQRYRELADLNATAKRSIGAATNPHSDAAQHAEESIVQHTYEPIVLRKKEVQMFDGTKKKKLVVAESCSDGGSNERTRRGAASLMSGNVGTGRDGLSLTVGCKVMLLRNLDVAAGLFNGSIGVVTGFVGTSSSPLYYGYVDSRRPSLQQVSDEPIPLIRFPSSTYKQQSVLVGRYLVAASFTEGGFGVDIDGNSLPANTGIWHLPLRHAWALTIHKCQGITLDAVDISMRGVFAEGQSYVALSRVRNFSDLCVTDLKPSGIRANAAAVRYYQELESLQKQQQERTGDMTTPIIQPPAPTEGSSFGGDASGATPLSFNHETMRVFMQSQLFPPQPHRPFNNERTRGEKGGRHKGSGAKSFGAGYRPSHSFCSLDGAGDHGGVGDVTEEQQGDEAGRSGGLASVVQFDLLVSDDNELAL